MLSLSPSQSLPTSHILTNEAFSSLPFLSGECRPFPALESSHTYKFLLSDYLVPNGFSCCRALIPFPSGRITTAPTIGPAIGGAFAAGPGWRWIFWFLAIASGTCLLAMVLFLPETNRSLVGNAGIKPARIMRPVIQSTMQPWRRSASRGPSRPAPPPKPRRIPNPVQSLRVLLRKDVAVSIMPGSLFYTVYCCINTSLSTTFIRVYHLKQWQAGLIYLPFGAGAILATLTSSQWIDRDYRMVATAHGFPTKKLSGIELLHFPIEEARTRGAFVPTIVTFMSVFVYGWLVEQRIVSTTSRGFFNVDNTLTTWR